MLTVESARAALTEAEAVVETAKRHVAQEREALAEGESGASRGLVERAAKQLERALDKLEDAKAALRVAERRQEAEDEEVRKAVERAKYELGRQARIRYTQLSQELVDKIGAIQGTLAESARNFDQLEATIGKTSASWPLSPQARRTLAATLDSIRDRAQDEARRFAGV